MSEVAASPPRPRWQTAAMSRRLPRSVSAPAFHKNSRRLIAQLLFRLRTPFRSTPKGLFPLLSCLSLVSLPQRPRGGNFCSNFTDYLRHANSPAGLNCSTSGGGSFCKKNEEKREVKVYTSSPFLCLKKPGQCLVAGRL